MAGLPRLPCCLVGLALLAGAAVAGAQEGEGTRPIIYKWVDENGIAHYTADPDRVPSALRDQLGALRAEPTSERPSPGIAEPRQDGSANAGEWAAQEARGQTGVADTKPGEGVVPGLGAGDPDALRRQAERLALEERIAGLREEILQHEERIKAWVSDPNLDPVTLADDPEFREVAARLPRLQHQMHELEQQKQTGQGAEP